MRDRKPRPKYKKRGGFTLVELLVVVAIIAILMAILMPALSIARDKARQVACIGNVKQIGLALEMWRDNSVSGYYPIYAWPWYDTSRNLLNP